VRQSTGAITINEREGRAGGFGLPLSGDAVGCARDLFFVWKRPLVVLGIRRIKGRPLSHFDAFCSACHMAFLKHDDLIDKSQKWNKTGEKRCDCPRRN
jgi:hypothetical protein